MIDHDLPFIDLHRHLDGSVRLETILDLGRKHRLPLPAWTVDELRPHVQITEPQPGVMAFIARFKWMVGVLVDYDACYRIAYENVQDVVKEGIDYAELRFSPWFMAEPHHLDPAGVVDAVVEGVKAGCRDFNARVNLIGIISRTYGVDIGWKELNALLTRADDIVGLDLAGDEANYPAALFQDHFKKGRDAGWHVTVHAGEASGAQSIWDALQLLGAERIGHGVHAVEDLRLMDYLAEYKIGVEVNLTSNLQTQTVGDLTQHPVKKFLAHGIPVSLNTDDPGISNINLRYEYEVAAPKANLTREEIRQLQLNALWTSFLTDDEKEALLAEKQSQPCRRDGRDSERGM